METVYVDVLFILNFLLTGAMIGCTALLTHRHLTRGRMTMGSLIGGIGALFLLLPLTETVRTVCLWPVRLLTAVGIILCAFGRKGGWRSVGRLSAVFFLVSLLLAGVLTVLIGLFAPTLTAGGIVYFHLSPLWLLAAGGGGCLATKWLGRLTEKQIPPNLTESFTVNLSGRETVLNLMVDTGNRLSSYGTPVAVLSKEKLCSLLPQEAAECVGSLDRISSLPGKWKEKLRLIPCKTAAGETLLRGFPARLIRQRDGAEYDCILAAGDAFAEKDTESGTDGVIAPLR